MPSYKLSYFDLRGRGELIRYVFLAADKPFEDFRFSFEEWPGVKPSSPYGQAPFLEVDGKLLAQSYAIARYLAREFGLAGKSNWDQAKVDELIELSEDLFKEVVKHVYEKDEEKKKELQTNLTDVVYPKFMGLFEKSLTANGGKYFVGDGLTIGDLSVCCVFDNPVKDFPNLMDGYPKLKAHRQMVEGLPKLAEYLKTRKDSYI